MNVVDNLSLRLMRCYGWWAMIIGFML